MLLAIGFVGEPQIFGIKLGIIDIGLTRQAKPNGCLNRRIFTLHGIGFFPACDERFLEGITGWAEILSLIIFHNEVGGLYATPKRLGCVDQRRFPWIRLNGRDVVTDARSGEKKGTLRLNDQV